MGVSGCKWQASGWQQNQLCRVRCESNVSHASRQDCTSSVTQVTCTDSACGFLKQCTWCSTSSSTRRTCIACWSSAICCSSSTSWRSCSNCCGTPANSSLRCCSRTTSDASCSSCSTVTRSSCRPAAAANSSSQLCCSTRELSCKLSAASSCSCKLPAASSCICKQHEAARSSAR
jgi:hypothetical protein